MQSPGTKPRDLVYITKHGGWWLLSDRIFSLVVKEFRFGGSGIGGKEGWRVGRGQGLILVSVSSNQTHLCFIPPEARCHTDEQDREYLVGSS